MKTAMFLLCGALAGSTASAPILAQEVTVPRERRAVVPPAIPDHLRPVERLIGRGHERLEKGLGARTSRQSLAEFRRAERTFQSALDKLDRAERKYPDDLATLSAVDLLRDDARGGAVTAAVNAGHVYLARTDYRNALMAANRALLLAPDDVEVLQFRSLAASLPGQSLVGGFPLGMRVDGVPFGVRSTVQTGALSSATGIVRRR